MPFQIRNLAVAARGHRDELRTLQSRELWTRRAFPFPPLPPTFTFSQIPFEPDHAEDLTLEDNFSNRFSVLWSNYLKGIPLNNKKKKERLIILNYKEVDLFLTETELINFTFVFFFLIGLCFIQTFLQRKITCTTCFFWTYPRTYPGACGWIAECLDPTQSSDH